MINPSNRTLVYLLTVAILVSLMGTLISLNRLGELEITGLILGNDTGVVNLSITTSCSVSMTGSNVDFGSGTVNGSTCELNTSAGTKSSGCSSGINNVSEGLGFTNDGNENITLNITSNVTAISFFGGTDPLFKINANNTESGACNSGNFAFKNWTNASTTTMSLCNSTNPLEPENSKDEMEINFYIKIPSNTGAAGGSAKIQLIGVCG